MPTAYDDVAMVHCTDNGKNVEAPILEFKPEQYLSLAINTVRVSLQYNATHNEYVGSLGGYEFVTPGPKVIGHY